MVSPRRALVTGATGGLGLALTEALLAEGYAVRATGRNPEQGRRLAAMGADYVAADLLATGAPEALVAGQDAVFHAAALSSPWGPASAFQLINVDATRRLLAAARSAGCESFVYVSSPSVYARSADQLDLTEDSPLPRRFANAYAATKHAAERLVLAAAAPGFAASAIRPRALLGPDDAVLLPRILRLAARGAFPLFRGGRALIEPTDVRDAAAAIVAADRHRAHASGLAVNISGGRAQSVGAMVAVFCARFGLSPRLRQVSYPLAAAGVVALEGACRLLPGRPEPPATLYGLQTLAFSQTFDLARAREVLDYRPRHTWEDALERTAAAWGGRVRAL